MCQGALLLLCSVHQLTPPLTVETPGIPSHQSLVCTTSLSLVNLIALIEEVVEEPQQSQKTNM